MTPEAKVDLSNQSESLPEKEQPHNSFLELIIQHQDLLTPMYASFQEMKSEIKGWKNSEAFAKTLDDVVDYDIEKTTSIAQVDIDREKHKSWYRRYLSARLFTLTSSNQARESDKAFDNLSDLAIEKTQLNFDNPPPSWIEFVNEYKEATDSLITSYFEQEDRVINTFENLLSSDIHILKDFVRFLSDKEFERPRQENSTLIRAIAWQKDVRGRKTFLDTVGERITEKEKTNLRAEYIYKILKERSKKNRSPQWQWISFATKVAGHEIDPASDNSIMQAAQILTKHIPFPQDLQGELTEEINRTINQIVKEAKRFTTEFMPKVENVSTRPPFTINRKASRAKSKDREIIESINRHTLDDDTEPEYENTPYEVFTISRTSSDEKFSAVTSEDLSSLINKHASKLAKGDIRMLDDLNAMVESLRTDPFGRTKKLTARTLGVNGKVYPLRSFAPDRRASLHVQHEASRDLRVVYVIDDSSRSVFIEGIYTHPEYDRRF